MLRYIIGAWLSAVVGLAAAPTNLFDGTTLTGWEGDTNKWWRVQEGALVGGSLKERVPYNDFLATTDNYTNFVLSLQFRLLGSKGFINSGVQIRSQRVPNSHEMSGYQCDLGDPNWWASIYDESRRNVVLAQSDLAAISEVLKRNDWNEFVIRAEGRRIRTWINGALGVDYVEPDENLPQWGRIGFQVHGGGAAEAWFKNIRLEPLPSTQPSPLLPEEQLASFVLAPGFEIELVAAEPVLPKPITVAWDDQGRLWTMTAVEYPVDANETPAQAEAIYANGGRDRILVFDHPEGTDLAAPRVFADKLALPLGLLPYEDGAFVQYGTQVLRLRDTDKDGRADRREVVLEGFGTQDSHLLPHQFTRAPGGWIYLAQGAFNYSKVRTKDGTVVQFDHTKLARFRPDGSAFEVLTHGPCNIWGLVINRFGETFIQEANDYGYPVIPFQPGINIPGCGDYKFRPYAPMEPPLGPGPMGGTGLSGLALSEGSQTFPGSWRDVMFVANPITRCIQSIRIHRANDAYSLEKLPDLVRSIDPWFRPVAIHFGPDGCLYMVDWYNKIISHNEVPRSHPDRDKTRGRLWRVRHRDQPRWAPVEVTSADNAALLKHLVSGNNWEWRAALNQITARQARDLTPALSLIAQTGNAPTPSTAEPSALRIRALWALENLHQPAPLDALVQDSDRNVRREAVRAAAALPPEQALKLITPLGNDPDHLVRTELIRSAAGQLAPWTHLIVEGSKPSPALSAAAIAFLVQMGRAPLPAPDKPGPGYNRTFERYLVRAFLEVHPTELAEFLESPASGALPVENRALAALALPGPAAARWLASNVLENRKDLSDEEAAVLFQNQTDPEVSAKMTAFISQPGAAASLAGNALRLRTRLDAEKVAPFLQRLAEALTQSGSAEQQAGLELIGAYRLEGMETEVGRLLDIDPAQALKILILLRGGPIPRLHQLALDSSQTPAVRQQAIQALAVHRDPAAAPQLLALWPALPENQRQRLIDTMAATRAGSFALLQALQTGLVQRSELSTRLVEKMHSLLPDHPDMQALWNDILTTRPKALRLEGGHGDYAKSGLRLEGPFTVETWVRLDPNISNLDGILAAPDVADFNFFQGQFRVWLGGGLHDVVAAKRKIVPETWTHVAATRDAEGVFRIYINGELEATSTARASHSLEGLDVGRTSPTQGGTAGWLAEYRVWNVARSSEELMANFDQQLRPPLPGLIHCFSANTDWPPLQGKARVEGLPFPPPLISAEQARALAQKLDHFRALAAKTGNSTRGAALFKQSCLVCHQAGGQGAGFAPNLDGTGLRSMDALLRAILTPSAAVESGYRTYRVETDDGEIHEGFLAQQDADAILLRQPNVEPLRVPLARIKRARFLEQSLMPEGVLEALPETQARDLLSYLRTLR